MTAWKRSIEEILEAARDVGVSITEGDCRCPDAPHQNLLHDIAVDLPAALVADRKAQRAEALRLAAESIVDPVDATMTAPAVRLWLKARADSIEEGHLHG